jgi:alpha-N-arabinofuranosidase
MEAGLPKSNRLPPAPGEAFAWSNPVVQGNAPDPSVIRVGSDYFLAVSTFEYLPGIVIRHSTDLVNWRIVGGAVTRPAQYRRDSQPGDIMLFAPTLRYHAGLFYLACTNMADSQGNFIVTATDPAGPWSDAIWLDREAFDPSLFFDADGTCYYTRRSLDLSVPGGDLGPVVQAEMDPLTGRMGPLRPITPGPRGFMSNDIEGPHLYRIGEWYYLFSAEGSTWISHMQTVARSRSPWGPFEPAPHNPVITHRNRVLHPIQTLGHADLVEDPRGRWWCLALGTRHREQHHNLGRETFLMPVEWIDGWPHIGRNGGTELQNTCAAGSDTGGRPWPVPRSLWTDGWHTLWQPLAGMATDGEDVLLPTGPTLEEATADRPPGALFRFQTEEDQLFGATVPDPEEGEEVGVAAFADVRHVYRLVIRCRDGRREAVFRRGVDDLSTETTKVLPGEGQLRLEIEASPLSYCFSVRVADERVPIGEGSARLLSAEACEWFVGVNFALLACRPGSRVVRFRDVSWGAAQNTREPHTS